MTPLDEINQRKIIRIYAAFGASLILSLIPLGPAAVMSLALGIGVLVIAYVLRTDSEPDSLLHNHMTFIIRTIWIGSFIALLCVALASIYLFKMLDNAPLQVCANDIIRMVSTMTILDPTVFDHFMDSECWINYWRTNLSVFITGGVIAAVPVLLYFLVRYMRGLTRAKGGYRVANPRAWF